MIKKYKLSVHHIGGRGGSRSFPILKKFEKDIINVIYDADSDCIEQIQENNEKLDSELYVLPYCLNDKCGPATININYDPYTSSLLETNNALDSFYSFYFNHDMVNEDVLKTMERRQVDSVTLDYLFGSKELALEEPDFLSIDIEGAEIDLLLGAKNVLLLHKPVIVLSLHPQYIEKKNQSLSDLRSYLEEVNFKCLTIDGKDNNDFHQKECISL